MINSTSPDCYLSHTDLDTAQTVATYLGLAVIATCSCIIGRCVYKAHCCF